MQLRYYHCSFTPTSYAHSTSLPAHLLQQSSHTPTLFYQPDFAMAVLSTLRLLQKLSAQSAFQLSALRGDHSADDLDFEGIGFRTLSLDASSTSIVGSGDMMLPSIDPFDSHLHTGYTRIDSMANPYREHPKPKPTYVWYCDNCGDGPIGNWQPACSSCDHKKCSGCTVQEA